MKNLILFLLIFGLGGLTFFIANRVLKPHEAADIKIQQQATTTVPETAQTPTSSSPETKQETVTVLEDGSQLDGPFPIFKKDGTPVEGTVRIIRSPEENLIQFEGFTQTHSSDDDIYFASDLKATSHVTLGYAKLNSGVTVYGIPLDATLDSYPYILLYDVKNKNTEYYAKVR